MAYGAGMSIEALLITAGLRGGAFTTEVGAAGALTIVKAGIGFSAGTGGMNLALSGGLGIFDLYSLMRPSLRTFLRSGAGFIIEFLFKTAGSRGGGRIIVVGAIGAPTTDRSGACSIGGFGKSAAITGGFGIFS